MVEVNPSDPQRPLGPGGERQIPKKPVPGMPVLPPNNTFQVGKGWGSYKTWLGKDGYAKFQGMLCKNISHQMGQAKIKEQKRKEIMKKAIEGKTDIFS